METNPAPFASALDRDVRGSTIRTESGDLKGLAVLQGVVFITLAYFLFLPPVANHFGLALLGPRGLPSHIQYGGRRYENTSVCAGSFLCKQGEQTGELCGAKDDLSAHPELWPMTRIGSVPTVVGPAHTIVHAPIVAGQTPVVVFVSQGNDCYLLYGLEGGP